MRRLWLSEALVVICLAFALSAGAAEYYVSPSGSDTNGDGSQLLPWRTIQKAADTMSAGDTCHVSDGEYAEMVRPASSGIAGQYISFVAEGSAVCLNGTRQITGWTVHSGNIWKANAAWDFSELFVDRQRMVLARWPNLTSGDIYRPNFYQATTNGGKTSIIDSVNLTQPSGYWSGAKLFMVPGLGWTAEQIDVAGYDPTEHRITFTNPQSLNYYDADEYSLYFLYDMLSLLDAPSEWFLDRAADTVYLWMPGGSNPSSHLVEAAGGSGGFDLTDRSYIRVTGFKLMNGDIKMRNVTGCLVEDVRHLYPVTELSVSGSDNVITRSEIAYASGTGVRLAGTRNTLSKCHVHHCDYLGANSIVDLGNNSFWPSGGWQNSIVDCSLHDSGHEGVNVVPPLNLSACLIEHNEIYNAGLIAKDLGGFYCYSSNGGGTEIKYNIVHDIWPKESPQYGPIRLGYGIYLDENSSGFSVHHNVVYLTGGYAIMLHQASRNNLVYNNTAVGSGGGWGDVINSSPGGNYFGVEGTVVANNLAAMLDDRMWGGGWCINFVSEIPAYHHNGYYNLYHSDRLHSQGVEGTGITGNPLFTNAAGNDFALLAGSPMIDKGLAIPGITEGYVGAAPDIGAYELGGSEVPGPRYTIIPDTLTLTTPNGGESWMVTKSFDIVWSSTGMVGNVNIDYSTNSGTTWTSIVANTTNDGIFSWAIPSVTPSTTCLVRVQERFGIPTDESDAVFSIIAYAVETISAPTNLSGTTAGPKNTSYDYAAGGSVSNWGDPLQYKFDWDDGSDSGWLAVGTTTASHGWAAAGTYNVRAMARCAAHTTVDSLWSATLAVIIYDDGGAGAYNSPAQYKVLPEVIWAVATGGGTWMSAVQVTDVTGGSIVSVYYNTASGRRGPFQLWNDSTGPAMSSGKFDNLLATIDFLDHEAFAYFGTVGSVEFITQDGSHLIHAAARTLNGNYSKTFPAFSLHDSNTADTSRVMIILNLTNNSTYRSTCGMFNPTTAALTVALRLRNAANGQIGTTISKTVSAYGFTAFSPFNDAGVAYPANTYDNVILEVQPTSGTGKVLCFGASANNVTNDPAAHLAMQNGVGHDNGPSWWQILPEAIWALATGGGTWMSEAQIVDVTGGSVVSVYFDYGAGNRRGPFVLWTGGVAGSKVKYANILGQIGTIDSGFTYYGRVGTVEFQTQDSSHFIQMTARTLNGNYSKTFPGLNLVEAETADTDRMMIIQNYASNSTYRSSCGFFNPTGDAVTVEFTLLNSSGATIGTPFTKTFVGFDYQAFLPFTEAGVPYPANSYDNVILRVRPTSGSGQVVCFGASANNASNDPAAHIAVQEQ